METEPAGLDLKNFFPSILDLVMPRVCVVCGRELCREERTICRSCLSDVPYTYHWLLPRNPMADRLNSLIEERTPLGYEPYSYACALFHYKPDSAYSNITKSLKYRRNLEAGRYFASALAGMISVAPHFADADLVIPVPLHWSRRWSRGYNQAEIIAEGLSCDLGIRMEKDLLVRTRRTRSQAGINSGEKERNVLGAFKVKPRVLAGIREDSPRHILIVDDVFTTGFTACECHRVLRSVFGPSVRISVVTLGYAG